MPRILFALAILLVLSGAASLLHFVVEVIAYPQITGYRRNDSLIFFLTWLRPAIAAVLVIGAVGLLSWRKWSINLLRIWALASITLSLLTAVLSIWSVIEIHRFPTTRQYVVPPIGPTIATSILGVFTGVAFPLFVLFIVVQPELKNLWSTGSGGFEVLPLASPAPDSGA